MAELNPADLGYYEKRSGSGRWYTPGRATIYVLKDACENCGNPFMGESRTKFCSPECGHLAQRKPDVDYLPMHKRVHRARGKATEHTCVDCGNPAEDWSQVHDADGTDEFEHYEPRCRSCHRVYDTSSLGEANPQAKLTDARVRGIRASLDESGNPPPTGELAEIHGITADHLRRIWRRERWGHVK